MIDDQRHTRPGTREARDQEANDAKRRNCEYHCGNAGKEGWDLKAEEDTGAFAWARSENQGQGARDWRQTMPSEIIDTTRKGAWDLRDQRGPRAMRVDANASATRSILEIVQPR